MRIFLVVIMLASLSGCANMSTLGTYSSVAPKFKGQPAQDMVEHFGTPTSISGASTLQLYEWRFGEYYSEPETVKGDVSSGGSFTGTIEGGRSRFIGCIISASVDPQGTVTSVKVDSRTNYVGPVQDWVGCGKTTQDPFLVAAATLGEEKKLDQSSSLAVGMTMDEVTGIMGRPEATFVVTGLDEWHYCANGRSTDNFVAIYFDQERLVGQDRYVVTLQDTGGKTGHCSKFVRQGSYQLSRVSGHE
jgi:SmpA/OmlA family protein